MATLLLRHAHAIATMDDAGTEIADGAILARDGVIEAIGPTADLPARADEVVDLTGHVVTPGLVNTHHHLFQTLTRAVPAAQDATLFEWLRTLYPIWARMTPDHIRAATEVGLAELALAGCTLSSDHLYLFPNGARLDDSIEAARSVGLRFHATRGAMSIGESAGGLPPDHLVEREEAILADCERVIARYHDAAPMSRLQVAVAPCSPFSVSPGLMRDAAALARRHRVLLHTHLAENDEDVAYSLARFGRRPGEYAEDLGWTGPDVWHAHCVKLDASEIGLFARSATGVGHCPCSNMRLGSGIAPVGSMLQAGVRVGLGVDGSASNDSGHLLSEARQALLLQRVAAGPAALSARQALRLATRGGAEVLARADTGTLVPGMACDVAAFRIDGIAAAGAAEWDAVAALVLTGPNAANHTIVGGRFVVRDGQLTTIDLGGALARHRALALALRQMT
jgi:cytosine/adenosine deaminase-related metal-dependent hydrolase